MYRINFIIKYPLGWAHNITAQPCLVTKKFYHVFVFLWNNIRISKETFEHASGFYSTNNN